MSEKKARSIGISRQRSNNKDNYSTPFANPINSVGTSSGISARDRCKTILDVSMDKANGDMFYYPGHVHTLIAHPNGIRGRCGHTEAILDMLSIAEITGPGVLCEILNKDGDAASFSELSYISERHSIPLIRVDDIKKTLVAV